MRARWCHQANLFCKLDESFNEIGEELKNKIDDLNFISKDMDYLVLADNSNQSIDLGLSSHLERAFGIELSDWVDPANHLVIGQKNIFAGGSMLGKPLSLNEAVRDGRDAALSVHNILNET